MRLYVSALCHTCVDVGDVVDGYGEPEFGHCPTDRRQDEQTRVAELAVEGAVTEGTQDDLSDGGGRQMVPHHDPGETERVLGQVQDNAGETQMDQQ